jgi:predicted HTH domain antitoxin
MKKEEFFKPKCLNLSDLKKRQDEIQSYIEDDDTEWMEEYKKTISKISEEHAKLKKISELTKQESEEFEQEKEEIVSKIKEESLIPDEAEIEFEVYRYIGLHSQYERLLSNLYKLFENIFPNDELWPFMAEEERKHECWLKDILIKMKDGTINFKKPSYNPEIVLKAIINISEIIHYCKEFKINHEEAYRISFDQENSMLEDGFFGSFSSDAPAIENVFNLLVEDTIEHRNWLKRRKEFYNY